MRQSSGAGREEEESQGPPSWDMAKWSINTCLGVDSSIQDLRKSEPQHQLCSSPHLLWADCLTQSASIY